MSQYPGSGDYLWDRSGKPDADIARLEASLSSLRHRGVEPPLVIGPRAEVHPTAQGADRASRGAMPERRAARFPIAAMIGLAVVAAYFARPSLGPYLKLEPRAGAPVVGVKQAGEKLHIGQWLTTDSRSSAAIEVASLGTVTVNPNSKIRLKKTTVHEHRLEMPYGSIHAFITAPPRVFIVDTPAARAVDMGCEYTLDLDESGSGVLRVSLGHVLLEGPNGITSEVPMWGGTCQIRRGFGPGTPYFDDAAPAFVAALEELDFGGESEARRAHLLTVLSLARGKDCLSLWHLIPRTSAEEREAVYARLAELKPPPERVTRRAVMGLDPRALRAWFEAMRPF